MLRLNVSKSINNNGQKPKFLRASFILQNLHYQNLHTTSTPFKKSKLNIGRLAKLKQKATSRLNLLDEVKSKKERFSSPKWNEGGVESRIENKLPNSESENVVHTPEPVSSALSNEKLSEIRANQELKHSLKPYNTSWPLNQASAPPKTHVWRVVKDEKSEKSEKSENLDSNSNHHKIISFCIHNNSEINLPEATLESIIKQLEPNSKPLSKNMNIAWQDSISSVTWHGLSAAKNEYVSSYRQGVILPDFLEKNGKIYYFVIQPPHFILPPVYIRPSALKFPIILGKFNPLPDWKNQSVYQEKVYPSMLKGLNKTKSDLISGNPKKTKILRHFGLNCEEIETTFELPNHNDKRKHLPFPDDKFLYANSMDPESVSKMNKETAIITTIKQMVPIIEFDQTGKNKSTNTNKKSLTYVQYDISVSENKAKSFGLNKLNLYSEDFTRKYHYKTSGNIKSQRKTRIATWNVFSHREYGYDFLLGHCKFLVKDVQKSNENNLQNESNILKRDWRYRFDLSPAVTEITKPVLSPIYRVPELIHQCINLDADIFCLQEADLEVLAMYRHVFEAKYSSVSHPRREKCALMTFWKTSAYEALEVKEIPLSSGRNLGSSKIMKWLSREKYFQIVGADDNFYNSSVVVLKDKFNGKVRIVVNVHALYSEPVMDGLDRAVTDSFLMRIYQVLRILKEVDDLDKKYRKLGIKV